MHIFAFVFFCLHVCLSICPFIYPLVHELRRAKRSHRSYTIALNERGRSAKTPCGRLGRRRRLSVIFPRTASCDGNDGLLLAPIECSSGWAALIPVSKQCPPTPCRALLRACRLGGASPTYVRARRDKQRLQSDSR